MGLLCRHGISSCPCARDQSRGCYDHFPCQYVTYRCQPSLLIPKYREIEAGLSASSSQSCTVIRSRCGSRIRTSAKIPTTGITQPHLANCRSSEDYSRPDVPDQYRRIIFEIPATPDQQLKSLKSVDDAFPREENSTAGSRLGFKSKRLVVIAACENVWVLAVVRGCVVVATPFEEYLGVSFTSGEELCELGEIQGRSCAQGYLN